MKKKILIICGICVLAIISSVVVYNYNKIAKNIYKCTTSGKEENTKYDVYSFEKNEEENEHITTNCKKEKTVLCKECTLLNNGIKYEYKGKQLILLYNNQKHIVTIYDTNKFDIYDIIKNVKYDDKWLQRKQSEVALYNDNELYAFIFPTFKNNEHYTDIFYNIGDKKINEIEEDQTFEEHTPFKNYSYSDYKKNGNSYAYANYFSYTTFIENGLININSDGKRGIYDLKSQKYLIPLEPGYLSKTDGGYIRINENESIYPTVSYYNIDGEFVFSNDTTNKNDYVYKNFKVLDVVEKNTIMLICDDYDGLIFVGADRKLRGEIKFNINDFEKDILSKINNNNVKNIIKFNEKISEYYKYSYNEDNKLTVVFEYKNEYYDINISVEYYINLDNFTIENKKILEF